MSLTYTQYGGGSDWTDDAIVPGARVVFYDLLLELGPQRLEQHLTALSPEHHDADAIIFRASRDTTRDALRTAAQVVFPRVATWGLIRDDGVFAPEPLNDRASSQPLPVEMGMLRTVELSALLRRHHAIYTEDQHHYVLPSQLHTDTFVDVGMLLRYHPAVHRIADWVEDYVDADTVLVADTGTLLPLLIELQARSLERYRARPTLQVFEEYPDTILAVQETIRTIQARTSAKILFLQSVSSSGTLASWVTLAAPEATIVAICDTAAEPHRNALLHMPVTHVRHTSEEECTDRRIGIHRRTLERIHEAEWKEKPLNKKRAEEEKHFWEAADRANAVQLHSDRLYWAAETGVRHHPVYIDIAALLTDADFRQSCVDILRAKVPDPDLLILPMHDPTAHNAVRSLVFEAFGPLPVITAEGTKLSDHAPALLRDARCILIADDATVTGRTLAGLRRAVYARLQMTRERVSVYGFVIVDRPPTKEHRTNTGNPFVAGRDLFSGAQVFLPRPIREACPWCREKRLLNQFVSDITGVARDYVDERLQKLSAPMMPPVAFGTEGRLPPDARTKDSFLGELRHAAAVGAVSSVVIGMQHDELVDRGRELRVFKASSGLSFYDGVIVGSIFRTLHARNLHWSGDVAAVEKALTHAYDQQTALPGYLAEVGLAAIDGKLPRRPVEETLARVRDDPAVAVVQQLFALRPEVHASNFVEASARPVTN